MANRWYRSFFLIFCSAVAWAQTTHVYVGRIETESAVIAWGTTGGSGNTIGRDSVPLGKATVSINGRIIPSERNWLQVDGLKSDTQYPYEVHVDGRKLGGGTVRTYPRRADRLTFFVIGDWGSGHRIQYGVAQAMTKEFERRTGDPVRFVLTTGDNIYADTVAGIPTRRFGAYDSDWRPKFYVPYADLLRRIPFYPSLGNHDGNESERRADLDVYLDNFFFPHNERARYYQFSFGDFADFFALDSTSNTAEGRPKPMFFKGGDQFQWLTKMLPASKARWKIPYFHHPPYNAGPGHSASLEELSHFVKLFESSGVKVVFTGHEHNFQLSDRSKTGGLLYVVTGAGGQLRSGDITRRMAGANIAGWSKQPHFLVVEIEGDTMKITPIGANGEAIHVSDPNGAKVSMPQIVSSK